MNVGDKTVKLDKAAITNQVDSLAALGYKIIAFAQGKPSSSKKFTSLSFLGIVGIADPLRPEAKSSIHKIESAGVKVAMVTGDHTVTALTIANKLGMNVRREDIVTGKHLHAAIKQGKNAIDKLVKDKKVFAQIEPLQKKLLSKH